MTTYLDLRWRTLGIGTPIVSGNIILKRFSTNQAGVPEIGPDFLSAGELSGIVMMLRADLNDIEKYAARRFLRFQSGSIDRLMGTKPGRL